MKIFPGRVLEKYVLEFDDTGAHTIRYRQPTRRGDRRAPLQEGEDTLRGTNGTHNCTLRQIIGGCSHCDENSTYEE